MKTSFLRRSFWVMTLFMALAAAGLSAVIHFWGKDLLSGLASAEAQNALSHRIPEFVALARLALDNFYTWVVPAVVAVFLILGWIIWLVIAVFAGSGSAEPKTQTEKPVSEKKQKKDFLDHKIEQERKRRLFLHTLSILQREGRLLDFLDEDLSLYEDDQIGAAVRSIQEDCQKAVRKYIDLKPVLDGQEGDLITIEAGFDVDAIKLVGNVSGKPPFEGVLRHPGWKAGKKEVPRLSDIRDPSIMTPAEVEIG